MIPGLPTVRVYWWVNPSLSPPLSSSLSLSPRHKGCPSVSTEIATWHLLWDTVVACDIIAIIRGRPGVSSLGDPEGATTGIVDVKEDRIGLFSPLLLLCLGPPPQIILIFHSSSQIINMHTWGVSTFQISTFPLSFSGSSALKPGYAPRKQRHSATMCRVHDIELKRKSVQATIPKHINAQTKKSNTTFITMLKTGRIQGLNLRPYGLVNFFFQCLSIS